MIRSARLNTVCPERVRTKVTDRRRRKFRPETLRPMNGRLRKIKHFSCGLWRAVDLVSGPPTEGERRLRRLISQVTGQRGGRRIQEKRLPPHFAADLRFW